MAKMQYTLRNIPERLDNMVREEARKYGKSINTMLLEALERSLGTDGESVAFNDMDDLAGTWVEDEEFDRAIAVFDSVDEDLWK